jgi:hypothetical protein
MANDSNSPATKGDLIALEDHIRQAVKGDLIALEERMKGDLNALEERLTEKWRDMQTELIRAFYGFADGNHKRVSEVERESAGLKDRLAIIESRLMEVEKRLNMPPAA